MDRSSKPPDVRSVWSKWEQNSGESGGAAVVGKLSVATCINKYTLVASRRNLRVGSKFFHFFAGGRAVWTVSDPALDGNSINLFFTISREAVAPDVAV